ncbi:hypothetical protein, partial [Adlercreutzia sp.]|uniref:hypothetical protein n=1 Tax=Adlercreutzia sp. TaxID=1872387 RepID=UPI002E77D023
LTQGTKPADWRYQILLIVGTGEGYYSVEQIAIDHRLVIAESASKVVFSLRLHFDVEGFSLPFYISVEPHAATLNAGIN